MSRRMRMSLLLLLILLVAASPVLAHDSPEGSEWVMADWMFLSFVIFAMTAFVAFLIALKRGWLQDLEGEAKHYILQIDEPDYYTTDWSAKSEE
ncbi:MAG: hypothetical protein H6670_03520 [Anaerolineaceae bacterium]|nr:hypothetical protein [Anaerolineaceae bacterium]